MHHQFNIQQFYVLPTLYLCVLCGSEKRQRLFTYTVVKAFFPIQCSQISVRALICWKIHRRRPFVLPATTTCRWRWVWSNGGMILTGETWSIGRKTLYSVGGRWMNGWVWSNGGMILTGENWSIGRKTLYSVGGRWMDEYIAMVEWYWQGKT